MENLSADDFDFAASILLQKKTIEDASKEQSEAWIRALAPELDISYTELMEGARNWLDTNDYLCEGGRWEGTHLPDEFWDHYEIVTGKKVPEYENRNAYGNPSAYRGSFFSCSC